MSETIERVEINGLRHYKIVVDGEHIGTFPSMTTILGNSSDKSGLEEWKQRVGEEEAERISELSRNRGTVMHKLLEIYKQLEGTPVERLKSLMEISSTDEEIQGIAQIENGQLYLTEGWKFFLKFWNYHEKFFDRVEKVIMAEKFLWSKRGYAGTVDNISQLINKLIVIIDYKNSRKPKQDSWIEDYFMQVAGYSIAYWERTGVVPNGCEIWIANEIDAEPQIFTMTQSDIKYYFKEFMKRLEIYNENAKEK
jgi:hypothetical protein